MSREAVACEETNVTIAEFWKGVEIWLNNPHVVNRRILTSVKLLLIEVKCDPLEALDRVKRLQLLPELFELNGAKHGFEELISTLDVFDCWNALQSIDPIGANDTKVYLYIKKLLPRNSSLFSPMIEFIFIDKKTNCVTYLHRSLISDKRSLSPITVYEIRYNENGFVSLNVEKSEGTTNLACIKWLKTKLYPRLMKWMRNESLRNDSLPRSLSLVEAEEYAMLYDRLKQKYGTEMVKIWPECTDAAKFVYEDVAIATYLLLLWKKERLEKGSEELQTFLDLGCGNGLLVHILSSEGHSGTGIDLRKRKIWDVYPQSTRLEVRTIVPSASSLFPNIDWLIGNHSDELTPWIPVIAARSSYNCRFFVLPCCAYEFDGKKYQRRSALRSQYSEYMDYVKDIAEKCGFDTVIDKLRIPSTKRTCVIGWTRTYQPAEVAIQDKKIEEMINPKETLMRSTENVASATDEKQQQPQWSADFKPRVIAERVRNCTQLDNRLKVDIINIVTSHLLRNGHIVLPKDRPDVAWNAGREIELSEIAKIIPEDMLKQLRSECGGIQTLLKNHNHIFCVEQGKVRFRIPEDAGGVDGRRQGPRVLSTLKIKPCWFHENHPDGCFTTAEKCNFKH